MLRHMADELPANNGAAGVGLMTDMVRVSLEAVDSLDRKLALIPAGLGVVAGLSLPNPITTPLQVQLAAAALIVSVVAVALSLAGLAGRQTSIGPDPAGLTARFADSSLDFFRDAAGPLTETLNALRDLTATKAWYLNLSLVAASSAMLLFLAVRVLSFS